VWTDQTRRPDAIILFTGKEDNKLVEETYFLSIQPGSVQCTNLHTKISKKKMSFEIFYTERLPPSAGIEI
jgi:hypothetical protein